MGPKIDFKNIFLNYYPELFVKKGNEHINKLLPEISTVITIPIILDIILVVIYTSLRWSNGEMTIIMLSQLPQLKRKILYFAEALCYGVLAQVIEVLSSEMKKWGIDTRSPVCSDQASVVWMDRGGRSLERRHIGRRTGWKRGSDKGHLVFTREKEGEFL